MLSNAFYIFMCISIDLVALKHCQRSFFMQWVLANSEIHNQWNRRQSVTTRCSSPRGNIDINSLEAQETLLIQEWEGKKPEERRLTVSWTCQACHTHQLTVLMVTCTTPQDWAHGDSIMSKERALSWGATDSVAREAIHAHLQASLIHFSRSHTQKWTWMLTLGGFFSQK